MVYLTEQEFGVWNDEVVKKYTWRTDSGFNRDGNLSDVVLGFDDLDSYVNRNTDNFGCVVGRVANRIADGTFQLDGRTYSLARNWRGIHHLHGGTTGFDKVNWNSVVSGNKVIFSRVSKDGEEGYPGDLLINITYEVTDEDTWCIEYRGVTTEKTLVNLTNHSYFNLAGHETGAQELYNHIININADNDQPSITFYTGNFLPSDDLPAIPGKYGVSYSRHSGLCLEAQKCIDAIHHPNFPSIVLKPGEVYTQKTEYRFDIPNMVHLAEQHFGTFNNEPVRKFTWSTDTGFSVPAKNGEIKDVVLGFDTIEDYVTKNARFFGSTIGRCANRIRGGTFQLDGVTYHLAKNNGENHLHGGIVGFNKDGEEGYPGDMIANVIYEVVDNSLLVEFLAVTHKKTIINMTNHSYFNLAGHDAGADGLYDHIITVNADRVTETSADNIPTGRLLKVGGTPFDLRAPVRLGDVMVLHERLFDHNFCVSPTGEVYSNQPGVQVYTSYFLPAPQDQPIVGKQGTPYHRHAAFCLETQVYPDAVNHPHFPTVILKPGDVYRHKFSVFVINPLPCYTLRFKMVHLTDEEFGKLQGESVRRFTWRAENISVSVISYGAIIQSIRVPDKNGVTYDVVLGFDDLESYVNRNEPHLGGTIGRCANRIGGASFKIDGTTYQVPKNVNWKSTVDGNKVIFSYLSKDGEEGYPGNLITNVTYEVKDNAIYIDFVSITDKKTVVNLTNHSYFNLAGHDAGAQGLFDHVISINADKITETTSESIPTGRLLDVGGTPFDLRTPTRLGDVMAKDELLFDDNFCVSTFGCTGLNFISRVSHPNGRYLEVYSNQPGVQLYTSYYLPAPEEAALIGKGGVGYRRHGAFCLETQNYPDAVHHRDFPDAVLKPGDIYTHKVVFKFGVAKSGGPQVTNV
ncbi:unnamed protein product [Leptidea sinapis]|uniref:Galactose mutarotase n=1 Tax=Leptidea sinapis TaxID=189913 RepID=A0A5E4QUN5_9NEOP|nr:unnamed protein product [Leptidea sinapis]